MRLPDRTDVDPAITAVVKICHYAITGQTMQEGKNDHHQ